MRQSFSKRIEVGNGRMELAAIIPEHRQDGMYYEVNIKGLPRFYMRWSELDRYDLAPGSASIPYHIVLAVSDIIEQQQKNN